MSREITAIYIVNKEVNQLVRKHILDCASRIEGLAIDTKIDAVKESDMREIADIAVQLKAWSRKID